MQFRSIAVSADSLRMYKVVRHTPAWSTHIYLFIITVHKSLAVNLSSLPVLALCGKFNINNEQWPCRKLIVLVSFSIAHRKFHINI